MKRWAHVVPALVAALAPTAAGAVEVELTPSVGFRAGGEVELASSQTNEDLDGSATYGLTVAFPVRRDGRIEAIWAHQDSSFALDGVTPSGGSFGLRVDSLHLGGVYEPERRSGPRPFILFSAGLTRFDPEPSGFDPETGASIAVGGGATFPLGRRVGLRFVARGWFTFNEASFSGMCGPTACSFRLSGSGMSQVELATGLAIRL